MSQAGGEWIDEVLEYAAERPKAPFAGIGLAIQELVALGASRHCVTELVRGAQARQCSCPIGYALLPDYEPDRDDDDRNLGAWVQAS